MGGEGSYLITLHGRGSGFVLRVENARWSQSPQDLRSLALSAPHARTPLDAAPPGRLGPRALRAGALPRDDPDSPAWPQAVLGESQEAAGAGRPGAAAGVYLAGPRSLWRGPT